MTTSDATTTQDRFLRPIRIWWLLLLIPLAIILVLAISAVWFLQQLEIPHIDDTDIRYRTTNSIAVPAATEWRQVGLAKELVDLWDSVVIVDGGDNPIADDAWEDLTVWLPWSKNIDRNILISNTVLLRSPSAPVDCVGNACLIEREHSGHSWIELAEPKAVDFIPTETDVVKPDPGFLTVKVIQKCQLLQFEDVIYQLTDNRGNDYVMHATETGNPRTDVVLPVGWRVTQLELDEPLVVTPFGSPGECWYNIVGDHLGQGYHQYRYASDTWPE